MTNIPALSLQTFHLSVDYYFSLQCEVNTVQIVLLLYQSLSQKSLRTGGLHSLSLKSTVQCLKIQ